MIFRPLRSQDRRRRVRPSFPAGGFLAESLEPRRLLAGRTFYVDALRGDDANSGVSLDRAWKTYRNFVSYYGWPGSTPQPANWVALRPGDTVLFRDGVYNLTTRYDQSDQGMDLFQLEGQPGAPITFKAYPGERPTFSARSTTAGGEMPAVHLDLAKYIVLDGLEITGTYGDGILVQRSDYVTIQNCWVHDVDGNRRNNMAGIALQGQGHMLVQNNLVNDNYDRAAVSPDNQNSRNILCFPDETTIPAGPGDELVVAFNTVFNTNPVTSDRSGAGIWVKHERLSTDWDAWFHDNVVSNVQYVAIGGMSPGLRIEHNLVLNSEPIDMGDSIAFNTVVGGGLLVYTPQDIAATPLLNAHDNVVFDTRTSSSDYAALVRIRPYGTAADYARIVTAGRLSFDNNVYWAANVDPRWVLFADPGSNGGTALGGSYDLPAWQARGYDAHSRLANPLLGAGYVPADPIAASKGWLGGGSLQLGMTLSKALVSERAGAGATTLILSRGPAGLSQPLTVQLASSDPSELSVPASVSFPANVAVISVPLTTIADGRNEPTRAVQLVASAPDGAHAVGWVRVTQAAGPARHAVADYDGDGKSDLGYYQTLGGVFVVSPSAGGKTAASNFGGPGWQAVTGDYDGDGKADVGLFNAGAMTFIVYPSSGGPARIQAGVGPSGGAPLFGDYDGDGKTDLGYYNPGSGRFVVWPSGGASPIVIAGLGGPGWQPTTGDYDGDGKTDVGIYQPATSTFVVTPSSGGKQLVYRNIGPAGSLPLSGDYDGDGKTDVGYYNPASGLFVDFPSSGKSPIIVRNFGGAGWRSTNGDYDGDGKTDVGISSGGTWVVFPSHGGAPIALKGFGGPSAVPLGVILAAAGPGSRRAESLAATWNPTQGPSIEIALEPRQNSTVPRSGLRGSHQTLSIRGADRPLRFQKDDFVARASLAREFTAL